MTKEKKSHLATIEPSLTTAYINYIDRGEKTTRTYINNLRQFYVYIQTQETKQPTRETILLYKDYLLKHYKANTAKQYLQTVRQFFKWTAALDIYPNIAENVHLPKIKQDTHRKAALLPADVLRIEKSIKEDNNNKIILSSEATKDTQGRTERATEQGKRLLAIYTLAVNAGLRCVELSRANIKDFEKIGNTYFLYIWGKGHTEADQRKALADDVAKILIDYLEARQDDKTKNSPLFVATGNRSNGQRLAPGTISTMLKGALVKAGYNSERITAHSLRHTAGTNVQSLTNDLYLTQRYMRHQNPATTEIYLHTNTEQMEALTAARLYALYHGETV